MDPMGGSRAHRKTTTTKDPNFVPEPHTQAAYVERVRHVIIVSLRPNKRENNAYFHLRGGRFLHQRALLAFKLGILNDYGGVCM